MSHRNRIIFYGEALPTGQGKDDFVWRGWYVTACARRAWCRVPPWQAVSRCRLFSSFLSFFQFWSPLLDLVDASAHALSPFARFRDAEQKGARHSPHYSLSASETAAAFFLFLFFE